jgi:hypothetical protein
VETMSFARCTVICDFHQGFQNMKKALRNALRRLCVRYIYKMKNKYRPASECHH